MNMNTHTSTRELYRNREQRIEVVMINSHNGSCSYQLMAGIFRLVCTNGLIVGARIAAINIRHMGHTGEEVIAALSLIHI